MIRDRWRLGTASRLAGGLLLVACGGNVDLFGPSGGGGGSGNGGGAPSNASGAPGASGGSGTPSSGVADAPGIAGAAGDNSGEPATAGAPPVDACRPGVAVTVPQVDAAQSAKYRWSSCGRIAPGDAALQALYAEDGSILALEEGGGVRIYQPGAFSGSLLADTAIGGDGRMAFADGGARLLLSDSSTAHVLEAADQKPIGLDSGKLGEVVAIDTAKAQCGGPAILSSDGSTVIAQGQETLCAWDVDQGALLAHISVAPTQTSWPSVVGTDAMGSRVLAFRDGVLSAYTLDGQRIQNVDLKPLWAGSVEPGQGASAAFTAEGKYLLVLAGLSGPTDGQPARLIAIDTASAVVHWQQPISGITDPRYLTLSARGYAVVTGDAIYLADNGSKVSPTPPGYFIDADVDRAGGEMLAASFRQVRVWDLKEQTLRRLYGAQRESMRSLDLSRDGRFLASNDGHGGIVWELASDFSRSTPLFNSGVEGGSLLALAPDGATMLLSGDVVASVGRDGTPRILGSQSPPLPIGEFCFFNGWDYAPNGCFVAGMRYTNDLLVYDAQGVNLVASRATGGCAGVAFSPDSSRLMTAKLELFDTSDWSLLWSKAPVNEPPSGPGPETTIAYSPDGSEVVVTTCTAGAESCSSSRFDARSGAPIAGLPRLAGFRARYSPEGQWIVAGSLLQHLPTGSVQSYAPDATVAVFTPEGDIIAGQSDGSLVRYCRSGD